MKLSVTAFLVTVAAVAVSGVVSLIDGTFTSRKVTMGFLNHGGMWSDLIVMSTMTGLVFPYFVRGKLLTGLSVFVSAMVSVIAHAAWAKDLGESGITSHIFPTHQTGTWYLDLGGAGWAHVLVMTFLFGVVLMYAVSPAPRSVVLIVSVLLTAHVFFSTVQPGWYCTGRIWTWGNVVPPSSAAGLVWAVAAVKIYFAGGDV